ncbi:restriction endonuclease subunit S [Phaeodactylibacter xiamenensis]|uniref:restriction endonuclease subunit S n=1 Tax=Phaeodactylibacter xiamenensis TaxID=1524460 RepID=UPI0024A8F77E|nr:restriction endonuclease subunit S [Phaeodactylibacter xiamenensis]
MKRSWQIERLGELCETYAGGTPSRSNPSFYLGDIPWITSSEVNQSKISETNQFISKRGLDSSSAKWIPKGAILIAMYGATAGQIAELEIRATANQAVLAVIPRKADSKFIYYQLNQIKDKILFLAQGSGQPNLSKSLIDKMPLSLPSFKYQRKIAHILSTCDRVIKKTEAAIAKYEALKQGLMQDLFTRGIDVETGALRPPWEEAPELYKETDLGWLPEDWEVKALEDFLFLKSGNGITSESISSSGNFPVYGGNGLRGYTNSYTHQGNYVLVGRQGALCGNVVLATGKFYASEHAVVVNTTIPINIKWLELKLIDLDLNKYSEASAQPGLSVQKISRIKVATPLLNEQDLIGSRFLLLEKKLLRERENLSKYHQLQIGLMQDLLTGRVEVELEKN